MTIPQLGFLDRVIYSASSSGVGPFVFSSAVTGFQSPLAAAAIDGQQYGYAAQSADLTQWEYGYGTWTQATQTLTRTVLGNMLNTTSPVNFINPPAVLITLLAESMRAVVNASFTLATGNLNFYVATTGSDSNPGTITQPFATIQHAVIVAAQFNYQNLYFPTINVANGTYNLGPSTTDKIILPGLFNIINTNFPSGGLITGNPATPANCVLDASLSHGHFVYSTDCFWSVTGFTLRNAPTGSAFNVNNFGCVLNLDSLVFNNNLIAVNAFAGGQIFFGFDNFVTTFVGGGHNIVRCRVAAQFIVFGSTFTFTGAQNYSVSVIFVGEGATVDFSPNVLVNPGNVTGVRYQVEQNGVLSEFPTAANRSQYLGTVVGSINTGGILQEDPLYNIYVPTSGSTVTTTPGEPKSILVPAGPLAILTVDLPTNMSDAETWTLSTSQAIDTLFLATTDGSSIVSPPVTLSAGSGFTMMFDTGANKWYPLIGSIDPIVAGSNLTFYVATTGLDTNPGTAGLPFLTLQHALNVMAQFDYQGIYVPTINVADGTYVIAGDAIRLPPVIGQPPDALCGDDATQYVQIIGNTTTPANVVLSFAGTITSGIEGQAGSYVMDGFKLLGAADEVWASGNLNLTLDNIIFDVRNTQFNCVNASKNAQVEFGYSTFRIFVQGSDATFILFAKDSSKINDNGVTFTVSNVITLHGQGAVIQALNNASIFFGGGTIVNPGNLHGPQYQVSGQALYFFGLGGVGDRSSIPGTSVGIVSQGGIIVAGGNIYQIATPTTGNTVTVLPGTPRLIINPAGTLATLTVVLPGYMSDGEVCRVSTTQTLTGLTVNATTTFGSTPTVVGGPTTLAAGGAFEMLFDTAANKWYIN